MARANALSFIRFFTELTSRSSTLFDGRTSAAATMKPDSSSQANSVCSSRDSRATPVWSPCERMARIMASGIPLGAQDLGAPEGVIVEARAALVVEVVQQRRVAPEASSSPKRRA